MELLMPKAAGGGGGTAGTSFPQTGNARVV